MKKNILIIFVVVAAVVFAAWGPVVSMVEQAKYDVVEKQGRIELRDYAPHIVAETQVTGPRKEAISNGFRAIAGYIFGDNVSAEKVAMTAPVIQQPSEKIAMTAPVIQQGTGNGPWTVQFVMPSGYTMQTLPKPKNDAVKLREVAGKRYAAIRFSGMAKDDDLQKQTEALMAYVVGKNLKPLGEPTYAFFNPPWTLPFLRRNEVMIEVTK
ncbi:MAG: heme-binding protein [Alphaproteobacteria bacterium]|nr:heme-binding protein [Alphaproteobacteria bacterium]